MFKKGSQTELGIPVGQPLSCLCEAFVKPLSDLCQPLSGPWQAFVTPLVKPLPTLCQAFAKPLSTLCQAFVRPLPSSDLCQSLSRLCQAFVKVYMHLRIHFGSSGKLLPEHTTEETASSWRRSVAF